MLLRQLLYRCEPRFLTIIASYWLNLQSVPNYEELIRMLCERMTDAAVLENKLNISDGQELQPALQLLLRNGNSEAADDFESKFGSFRIAGMDKIIREKMWKQPVSITEKLWYRGFIYRETRSIDNELKDCYILPEDFAKIISKIIETKTEPHQQEIFIPVRPAIPSETAFPAPINNAIPDIFCLVLALKRDDRMIDFPGLNASEAYISFLNMLLTEGHFFNSDKPETDVIRRFLTQNRTAAKIRLINIWRNASCYEEIIESPEITVISAPDYIKSTPRNSLLKIIENLPQETWISVNGFISAIKKGYLYFLRSTFSEHHGILQDLNGNDLSGIGSWFQLEGAYIRFMIRGPLNWLGIVQCAYSDKEQEEVSAFRLPKESLFYLSESSMNEINGTILSKPNLEQALPTISGDGAISCSVKVPRYFRYMAARSAEIEKVKYDSVVFRITPASLNNAENAGLSRLSLLALLRRFSNNKVPPALERILSVQSNSARTAIIYSAIILTVPDSSILEDLLSAPRLEKWIHQQINSTSLLVDRKGITEIRRFLMEREIFVDIQINDP